MTGVTEASGWRTSDGSMWDSRLKAEEREAEIGLRKLDMFNDATRKAVRERAAEIVSILAPLVAEQGKEKERQAALRRADP